MRSYKVQIVNWLLTRKCNLSCEYCAIVKNYDNKPKQYPDISHYIKNEMSAETVIETLRKIKVHNPNAFHLFYGGEPLLRKDLSKIIHYCNENYIYYSIITSNLFALQPHLLTLLNNVGQLQGLTSSVDPIFNSVGLDNDMVKKSTEGLKRLKDLQSNGKVNDVVAEITVMNSNQHFLHSLISELSKHEIYSDITFVDIAKSRYYDFSNIRDKEDLVQPTFKLAAELKRIMDDQNLLVHMKETLIPWMFDTLPSNFDCELEKGVHNLTIDADGSLRLCLRIRGIQTPKYHVNDLIDGEDLLPEMIKEMIAIDKLSLCRLCNHTCLMMSKHINDNKEDLDDLIHSDKREE